VPFQDSGGSAGPSNLRAELNGFPWLTAGVLYTLSWGWSLLRPNTLYWDDWAFIFNQPKSYLNEIFVDTGLPPWRAIIDQELIAFGYWTIPFLTFLMFFSVGVFLWLILQDTKLFSNSQISFLVLIFTLLPINHSRIALVLFGYSTSYFLFFLGWVLIVRNRSIATFVLAMVMFFWSFMTHSFMFFYLLPVANFVIKSVRPKKSLLRNHRLIIEVLILLALPFLYFVLRRFFWYPKPEWIGYQSVRIGGSLMGLRFLIVGLIVSGLIAYLAWKITRQMRSSIVLITGWALFAFGLFPYFASGRFRSWVEVFAFRSDWGGRHIMLTPLGAGLILLSLRDFIPVNLQKIASRAVISLCVSVNIFFGTQFYLDSLKKDELVTLLANASDTNKFDRNSEIIFVDETKLFNGRWSTYRDPELINKLFLAKVSAKSITGKVTCSELPQGLELRLKSDKNFLSALSSRDLGLYLEINNC